MRIPIDRKKLKLKLKLIFYILKANRYNFKCDPKPINTLSVKNVIWKVLVSKLIKQRKEKQKHLKLICYNVERLIIFIWIFFKLKTIIIRYMLLEK